MVFTLFHTLDAVSTIPLFTETPIRASGVYTPCIDVTIVLFTQTLVQINTIWSTVKETQCTLALVGAICIQTGSMPLTLILFIAALIIVSGVD